MFYFFKWFFRRIVNGFTNGIKELVEFLFDTAENDPLIFLILNLLIWMGIFLVMFFPFALANIISPGVALLAPLAGYILHTLVFVLIGQYRVYLDEIEETLRILKD